MRRFESFPTNSGSQSQPTPGPRARYLLSGLLKCDLCGASPVIQNSCRSSSYVCDGYRNGGISVCSNNHRLSRFVLEGSFCEELRQILVSPTLLEDLANRVKKSFREGLATGQSQEKDLKRRRQQIDGRLSNLVGLVEAGDVSKAISRRILELERELETVDTNLARVSHSPSNLPTVALETVEAELKDLCRLLNAPDGAPGVQKQALKNLFPDRLSVVQEEAKNDVIFKVSGNVHPFNGLLLPTSLMSYSGAGT